MCVLLILVLFHFILQKKLKDWVSHNLTTSFSWTSLVENNELLITVRQQWLEVIEMVFLQEDCEVLVQSNAVHFLCSTLKAKNQ